MEESYLISCASTHNWYGVIKWCRDFEETRSNENRNCFLLHWELKSTDNWGNTALHISCYNTAPVQVIRSLLQAAADANPPIDLVTRRSVDGSTPLLVACATGATLEVIRELLNSPRSVQNQDSGCSADGSLTNFDGFLEMACDVQGNSPLSELCVHYELSRKSPIYRDNSKLLHEANLNTDRDDSPLLEMFWSKVETIIQSAWTQLKGNVPSSDSDSNGEGSSEVPSILHSCALISESCPSVISSLICRSFPDSASQVDDRGNLPLHLAVGPYHMDEFSYQAIQNRSAMISSLLQLHPTAARTTVPGTRRTPFCQAIASDLHWNEQYPIYGVNVGPVQAIWRCAPMAIHSRDVVTGLYPFLLAACVEPKECNRISQVGTIFCLLRLHPQLLGNVMYPSE